MASIKDRSEENKSRRLRLAQLSRGPGVFVYKGGAVDTEWEPTLLKVGRNTPVFDANNMPVVDGSGRQVFERSGALVRDASGQPILGGEPKKKTIPLDVYEVRGVKFPQGKEVHVSDHSLALKLRGMDFFEEVKSESAKEHQEPKKRGRKPKTEAAAEPASD